MSGFKVVAEYIPGLNRPYIVRIYSTFQEENLLYTDSFYTREEQDKFISNITLEFQSKKTSEVEVDAN